MMAMGESVHGVSGTAGDRMGLPPVAELKHLMKQSLPEVLTKNPAILFAAVESAVLSNEYTGLFPDTSPWLVSNRVVSPASSHLGSSSSWVSPVDSFAGTVLPESPDVTFARGCSSTDGNSFISFRYCALVRAMRPFLGHSLADS